MSVHEGRPGDIYRDEHGRAWLVVARCDEPTVTVEQLLTTHEAKAHTSEQTRMCGGVSGLMWSGFRKLSDPKEAA